MNGFIKSDLPAQSATVAANPIPVNCHGDGTTAPHPATLGQAPRAGNGIGASTNTTNQLLAALSETELTTLRPALEPVWLTCRENVSKVKGDGFVYFPEGAVVSYLSLLKDGGMAEVALIGNEGMIGLELLLNVNAPEPWARVAIAGRAVRARAEDVKREFDRGGPLQRSLLSYTGDYIAQISRRAVCNNQHKTEERFASWLLMMHDRAATDVLPLTQEQISRRLGTRRASITLAALALQQQQIIGYHRGRIRILDRLALERAACECYLPMGRPTSTAVFSQANQTPVSLSAHA